MVALVLWFVGSADVTQGHRFQLTIHHKVNIPHIIEFGNRSTLEETPEEKKGKD